MSTELTTTPEFLDFAPLAPRTHPSGVMSLGAKPSTGASFGMPSIDPEVNLRRTAKQGLVRWMERRIRDNCDADTARTKAKLIGELLHFPL